MRSGENELRASLDLPIAGWKETVAVRVPWVLEVWNEARMCSKQAWVWRDDGTVELLSGLVAQLTCIEVDGGQVERLRNIRGEAVEVDLTPRAFRFRARKTAGTGSMTMVGAQGLEPRTPSV